MVEREVSELLEDIEALVSATRREQAALRRASRTAILVSCAMFVIVAVFAFVNYEQFKNEWTEEKLTAGFEKELEVLNPALAEQIQKLGKHLLPVYSEAGRTQFLAMRQEIADRLKSEIDHLGSNLCTDAENRLVTATDRITTQTNEIVFAAYPGLRSESEQAKLTRSLHRVTDEAVTEATREFGELFAKDVLAVEERIHGFNMAETDEPTLELEKRFIHLWLQLLDAEIMKR